ncbi:hypothetical protein PSHT_04081 [Puccinia striiformis]|uniref:GCVT N-terminal domain-containing protein n=3 Tax=Puccinia striiformis TaxID=27350 RepID=A0A0L0W4E5_9BASI|nr:hypothetical protein H4Q26_010920 [Puccinia striiformis f. sp. tritici PST-130]KNF06150.1 hypothetical protein PSTG_00658 [Puccinia striiformis f. sp. tritici PST-78]POW14651.1 hypothetical protein PSTT_02774 [Puccinia striiformis]POW19887.1 hypothetical protein PSHT_04081 [Puccinia striiformis]
MDVLDGWGLVALQGSKASKILQSLLDNQLISLDPYPFLGQSIHTKVAGEDGSKSLIKPEDSLNFAKLLTNQLGVSLTGLAARDLLRLEAGMCLYGSYLDKSVGVGEAGLG